MMAPSPVPAADIQSHESENSWAVEDDPYNVALLAVPVCTSLICHELTAGELNARESRLVFASIVICARSSSSDRVENSVHALQCRNLAVADGFSEAAHI